MSWEKDKILSEFDSTLDDGGDIERFEIFRTKPVEILHPSATTEELVDFIIRNGNKKGFIK